MNDMLIDVSDYDMGTWEPACFRSAGVTKAITNSFRKSNAITRIQTLRAAGIEVVGVYGFCYFGPDPHYVNRDVDAAIELAKAFKIPMVWVDAELDAQKIVGLGHLRPSNPKERTEQLRAAVRKVEAAGLPVGIYTAGWWWPSNMAGSTEFSRYPLWHADYGANDGKRTPVTHVSYGGWNEVALHQYTSTKPLCGRGRDHNYELRSMSAQETEEDDMTPEQVEAIVKRLMYGSEERWAAIHDPTVGVPPLETRVNAIETTHLNGLRDAVKLLNEKLAAGAINDNDKAAVADALETAAAKLREETP